MWKLRSVAPVIVSIAAVIISTILLIAGHRVQGPLGLDTPYVPTVTLVSFGMTAPASLLTIPAVWRLLPSWHSSQLGNNEIYFVIGAALTWFIVAITWQRRGRTIPKRNALWWTSHAGVLFIAAELAYQSRFIYSQPTNNPVGNKIEFALFSLWVIALTLVTATSVASRNQVWRKAKA
jgi:hypothetical protein